MFTNFSCANRSKPQEIFCPEIFNAVATALLCPSIFSIFE